MTDRKIAVVTGGAGFVGSHLCTRLQEKGYRVISLDNYFVGSKENHVEGIEYIEGHTKDIAKYITEMPHIIFHLGEYARVEQSVLEPELVHDLNTEGTKGVVEFWRQAKCKLVYAGSSTKFGDSSSPYSQSKAKNSELVRDIGDKDQLPYAITYFYNVYGPGERSGIYGTVIEHFKRMYTSGMPCAVVAPGTQERNFTHVSDIVEGLLRAGEEGNGDEYGLGCKTAHTILDVAHMFGFEDKNIVMFPEREGNRMKARLDTSKAEQLGWRAEHELADHIRAFISSEKRGNLREKRILVFSTTMFPDVGPAEESFLELARLLPDVVFDVITTKFQKGASEKSSPLDNVTFHRVGMGMHVDKFLLPIFGSFKGLSLTKKHRYLFTWALMASYAALAASIVKKMRQMPLLVTLADQDIEGLSAPRRFVLRQLLSHSDQVYGTHRIQEQKIQNVTRTKLPRYSLGEGDAFANALRFAYAALFSKQ